MENREELLKINYYEKVYIKWNKAHEIMRQIGLHNKIKDPIGDFDWTSIGLKRIKYEYNIDNSWNTYAFYIIDKNKLAWAYMKYNFIL